jgi:uncharacterized protein (TIGR02598 family)
MKKQFTPAFSLVELTLALGIAAFCLLTIVALVPIAVLANRNATSQTAATNIMAAVIADMRAAETTGSPSQQYGITLGTPKTLYFDGAGQAATLLSPNSRYRISITFPLSPSGLSYADINTTWPAAATPANATGSAEMFAAFKRN